MNKSAYNKTLAEDLDHEVHILSSLRYLKHPNIINLVASYTKGETYNFLFPVASGDLKDLLWSGASLPGFQTNDEIISSLWGLSSALEAMHDFNLREFNMRQIGCHYDIQPRNILCLDGRLVLSDFGLSRLKAEENGSRSLFKRGEGSYLAPECEPSDKDFEPGKIGRASDVWSLGCILTEVLVYMSGGITKGSAMVEKFYEKRRIRLGHMTCYHFHGVDEVSPAVVELLDDQISNSACSIKFLASLTKLMLHFDESKRPHASFITLQLFKLSQRVNLRRMSYTLEGHLNSKNLELEVELERLKIWGEFSGLDSDPVHTPRTAWFTVTHSLREYENLQKILQQRGTEIDFIVPQIERESRGSYRLFHHLARLLDEL